jgi:hypothetical protein
MHIMMLAIRLQLLTKTSGDCGRTATCKFAPCVETSCFFPQGFCVLGPLRIIVTVGGFGLKYIVDVIVGIGRADLIEQTAARLRLLRERTGAALSSQAAYQG